MRQVQRESKLSATWQTLGEFQKALLDQQPAEWPWIIGLPWISFLWIWLNYLSVFWVTSSVVYHGSDWKAWPLRRLIAPLISAWLSEYSRIWPNSPLQFQIILYPLCKSPKCERQKFIQVSLRKIKDVLTDTHTKMESMLSFHTFRDIGIPLRFVENFEFQFSFCYLKFLSKHSSPICKAATRAPSLQPIISTTSVEKEVLSSSELLSWEFYN